ncbi:hypothetical protein [Streptomyces acidiscabies]|uniref:Uncharacterized protein n=2 Tax=Streptomyces acidiscabies TaxID=42234 RepID=A0AAP6EKR5_9ACTN|nr:hypothetical protein [Streptomyces acidiscabies]MBP5936923.1 hypothetical protein [Streptomyces sp. LBUM 1476]MBZ3915045.1 hypothetical protein [Streptomyces acidiscabies]MDX2966334.1 hypothetical protein [Streptomyces acidiscabies]MDX3021108.1 hypothetical protein [Streptomyces acidiscabies]MDX3794835.1 hypothetical protein [Streptomyces acidiscabies]
MDSIRFENWTGRLDAIRLFVRRPAGFKSAKAFEVAGIQHLLGIVGAGKSTLRDVLTVNLAERNRRVTVVVGDVVELLKLVQMYNTYLPGTAAPVLGAAGREQHAERLHRRLAGRGERNLLAHDDRGFGYLSTSCALNALRHAQGQPADHLLAFGEAPCTRLQRPNPGGYSEDLWSRRAVACPLWTACPRHRSARELVDAIIWVATPPSLVDSKVPHPQNREHIRYFELACRRSDLVIVDEADRVQMQLDRMFAPGIPLLGGGPDTRSFLDEVNQHRIRELAGAGRIQLSDRDVENWSAAVNTTQTAADRLVAMLVSDSDLRKWVRTGYFSAGRLQQWLLEERYPLPEDQDGIEPENSGSANEQLHRKRRRELSEVLDAFRDNPFGDRRTATGIGTELTGLTGELLHTNYRARTRERLREVICSLLDLDGLLEPTEKGRERYAELRDLAEGDQGQSTTRQPSDRATPKRRETKRRKTKSRLPEDPEVWVKLLMIRFEFTLLLSALEPRLALINAMWPRVSSALNLGFNEMYRRPPDYGPMVPEAPMGNVIGFQFLLEGGPDQGGVRTGELRFFRCSGVGRELLRAMPGLPTVDGHPGTNVLLMSGSSWAGKSSRYHIPVDIGVIIEPDPRELDQIAEQSEFRFEFIRYRCDCRAACECHERDDAQRLSGEPLDQRADILRRMVTVLGDNATGTSRLQEELGLLPESRRHILLLVGSYEEAKVVADTLHTLNKRWQDRVYRLVSDDDPDAGTGTDDDEYRAPVLRRGDVENLANTRAEILVAPLLAVERGHNILDVDRRHAAIGSIYFLARPNPRPDDLGLAVHAINDWIVRARGSGDFDGWVRSEPSLALGARKVRDLARAKWFRVLARSMAWKGLGEDRESVTWDLLVLIWQVIGRSVRGAVPTRVAFVDAAFAPKLAVGQPTDEPDSPDTSLLHSIHAVLKPYFTQGTGVIEYDRHIVRALYRPMWTALDRCLAPYIEEQPTDEGEPLCTT